MTLLVILPVALALAMDAFAVSVGLSVTGQGLKRTQAFRLALAFGFFQFLMPVAGWMVGQGFFRAAGSLDHWVAFVLLVFVGGKMVIASLGGDRSARRSSGDPTRGLTLVLLSVATSIDAFAVGVSLAALGEAVLFPAAVIGVVAFFLTLAGARLGPVLGRIAGRGAELLGGLILIFIGIKILVEHL